MFLIAALAALAVGALGASSASASIVSAKFSTIEGWNPLYLYPSGVVVKKGTETKSCTASQMSTSAEGSTFWGYNESAGETWFNCPINTNSRLEMVFRGSAYYDTVTGRYFLKISNWTQFQLSSPWGFYSQEATPLAEGTWVNGTGTTPSKVTFTNQVIGHTVSGLQNITLEGTFTAKTLTGGTVTLTH